MRRWTALLMAMTFLLGFCACGSKESDALPDGSSLAEAIAAAASAASDAASEASPAVSEKIAPDAPKHSLTADAETADDCVTVEETKTKYGPIQIPQMNEAILKSEDVRLANEMFRSIRDLLLDWVEGMETGSIDEWYYGTSEPLCVTKYAQTDSSISILVKYVSTIPDSPSTEFYESVNIDVPTGKALDHHDVIESAGFTEDEVRAALRSYLERCLFNEWENYTFYACAMDGTLPDGLGDPSIGLQEDLDEVVAYYDEPPLPQGELWDALPHYPAVYAGEEELEILVGAPTAAGGGTFETMVCIGHNDTETRLLNPNNPYGQPFGRGAMMSDAACEAVARSIGLGDAYTDSDGVHYNISAESMDIIEYEDLFDPAYVLRVNADEGDSAATSDFYAVSVFSGKLWEKNTTGGKWTPIMNGTGLLPEEIYTGADMAGALAVIWSEPGPYGLWAANPCAEVDMVAYGSNLDHYVLGGEAFLLFAIEDGTLISFDSGTMKGDAFTEQRQLYSIELNAGDSVLVYALLPEGAPTQAINVSTKSDAGKWVLRDNGMDGTSEITYVTSFSSSG